MSENAAADPAVYEPRLRARLAELRGRLEEIEHDLDEPLSRDFEDRATEREGDEVLESLGAAGLTEIRAIEAALERIDEGEFGYCARCGEPIRTERLDVVPHAALCSDCAGRRS